MAFFRQTYQNLRDEDLMQRSSRGDKKAFKELFTRYQPKMYRYFFRMLGQEKELANDFTQDLFLKIIEKGSLFNPEKSFSVWIYAIAGNMMKNEYRRRGRQSQTKEWPDYLLENGLDIDLDQLDRPLFRTAMKKALDSLDDTHRNCYLLRFQEELSIQEISEILDCPQGTVKSRLFYAMKKIVRLMKKQVFI
jgi:RNA polymerase sigma-70 factor (ECF subfamily)